MKKIIFLCISLFFAFQMFAQTPSFDDNWHRIVNEDFTVDGRHWTVWSFCSSDNVWRAYPGNGVTHGSEHQVYQFNNCRFNDADNTMELIAEYDTFGKISSHDYYLPSWIHTYPSSDGLLYFSGEIDYIDRTQRTPEPGIFLYGYFEIRCKLPVHKGAFPAFWLHAANDVSENDRFYEEIDIFEYSWNLGDPNSSNWGVNNPHPTFAGDPKVFTTGIYHNLTGNPIDFETESFARNYPTVPSNSSDLSDWHVFSCEWMPDHVYWFFDGSLVNCYTDENHIPRHPMILKTNYAIDDYCNHNSTTWMDSDTMTIDYIRVYTLDFDCNTDETIACQADLDNFDFSVKRSIEITSSLEETTISSTDKKSFRTTNSFQVTGPFQIENGGVFSVIIQQCIPDENNLFMTSERNF